MNKTVTAVIAASAFLLPAAVITPAHATEPITPKTTIGVPIQVATEATPTDSLGVQEVTPEDAANLNLNVTAPEQSDTTASPATAAVPYTVSIKKVDTTVKTGQQSRIDGTSTGFSDGNWVNVWIRPAGTTTWTDGGGNWVRSGKFSIPVAYPNAGTWEVQLSLGQYPAEQYSNIAKITVAQGKASTPYVVEAGTPDGKRYLKVSGTTNQRPGTIVSLYVTRPNSKNDNRYSYNHNKDVYAGSVAVSPNGNYTFNTANNATLLNSAKGKYTIKVTTGYNRYMTIGKVSYTNYN